MSLLFCKAFLLGAFCFLSLTTFSKMAYLVALKALLVPSRTLLIFFSMTSVVAPKTSSFLFSMDSIQPRFCLIRILHIACLSVARFHSSGNRMKIV